MARVKLDQMYYDELTKERILGKMRARKITQSELGHVLGVSQPVVHTKLANMSFSSDQIRMVFRYLHFSDREILEYMKGGRA